MERPEALVKVLDVDCLCGIVRDAVAFERDAQL